MIDKSLYSKPAPIVVDNVVSGRAQILGEALSIVTKDRNAAYGNPEDNFQNIADYWNTYLTQSKKVDIVITPVDVAYLMILMKMARLTTNPLHSDSLTDVVGYAACGRDCQIAASQVNKVG